MIVEGIEGVAPLPSIYKDLNKEYFGGVLPSIPVKWSGKLKNAIGQASVSYRGFKKQRGNSLGMYMSEIPVADVTINSSSLTIKLSKAFDLQLPDIKSVLMHEMVHILLYTKKKIGGHHGTPEFDGWIKKLRNESGYNVPFKESDFKKSPKLKAKEGLVMLIFPMSGEPGISVYSKNFFQKQWGDFMRRMARQVAHSSKVNRIEIYKISHPIVSAMGARRTSKGLSWQNTDEITVKEIQQGNQFMYIDKGGGSITPKVAGITTDRIDVNKKWYFDTEGVVGA